MTSSEAFEEKLQPAKLDMDSHLVGSIVAIGCFSYPITTVIFLTLGLNTSSANFVCKFLFALMYFFVFLRNIFRARVVAYDQTALLVFFVIYGIFLVWDIEVNESEMLGYTSTAIYLYFFALTMLPCAAVLSGGGFVSEKTVGNWVYFSLALCNLFILAHYISEGGGVDMGEQTRFQVSGDYEDVAVLNPIVVGLNGVALAVYALSKLAFGGGLLRNKYMYFDGFFIIAGLSNLLLSGSRGPFFAFALSIVVMLLITIFSDRSQISTLSKEKIILFLMLFIWLIFLASQVMAVYDFYLFERLGDFFSSDGAGNREHRSYLIEGAIADFMQNPLFGLHFVESSNKIYPHNIPVEVLMATGIFGGVFFILFSISLVRSIVKINKTTPLAQAVSISLVGVVFVVIGQTSGSIHSFPEFWIFSALLIRLGANSSLG